MLVPLASVPNLLFSGRGPTSTFALTLNGQAIHQVFVKWTSLWFVFFALLFFTASHYFGVTDIPSGRYQQDQKTICLLCKFPVATYTSFHRSSQLGCVEAGTQI